MLKTLIRLEISRIFAQFKGGKQKVFGIFTYLLSLWGIFGLGALLPIFGSTATLATLPKGEGFSLPELAREYELLATSDITVTILFIAVLLIAFFQMKNTFFHKFDQSCLWSQPIETKTIVLSKFIGAWIMGVPMIIAFSLGSLGVCYIATGSFGKTLILLLLFLAVEILAECSGYFLRTLSTRASRRLHTPKIVKTVLKVLLFAAVMGLYYYEISRDFKDLAQFLVFYRSLPPVFRMISYIMEKQIVLALLPILLAGAFLLFFIRYMAKHFFAIAETMETRGSKKVVAQKDLKPKSKIVALVAKELKLYWDNSAVAMNTFFGALMPLILSLLLLVPMIHDGFTDFLYGQEYVPPYAALFLILLSLAGIMNVAGYSFSLEGKSAYLTYTLPLTGRMVFFGKLLASLVLLIPTYTLTFLVSMAILSPDPRYMPLYFIGPVAYIIFNNAVGLLFDWKYANYTWTTPQEFAKNSKQAFFSSFGSLAVSVLIIFVGMTIMTAYPLLYAGIITGLLIIADIIIFLLTKNLKIYHY
ncbi:hypothetical protein PEPNEM18_00168 [Aedoeadaptatus nemausensis]|uniref:Uncharacterized protein n=1 Tax=Aedoeadaptatus nemausensis TaxID=2582829 RepID=A0A6V6XYU8_9FIRM|nr:hypothetical protein [Peptoniphilus nemausensis]CAC9923689.1 hypothetical protein PEPNEM18_00168 [Peptoniphilus nemausensis]